VGKIKIFHIVTFSPPNRSICQSLKKLVIIFTSHRSPKISNNCLLSFYVWFKFSSFTGPIECLMHYCDIFSENIDEQRREYIDIDTIFVFQVLNVLQETEVHMLVRTQFEVCAHCNRNLHRSLFDKLVPVCKVHYWLKT
jgi:hypothetical protein